MKRSLAVIIVAILLFGYSAVVRAAVVRRAAPAPAAYMRGTASELKSWSQARMRTSSILCFYDA
jgi:hypothetical protein